MKRIALLGSTGSIGTQTLDVVAHHPERFQVEVLAAGSNVEQLLVQIEKFRPTLACVTDESSAEWLRARVPHGVKVVSGAEGLCEAAAGTDAELVLTAVVGSVGLLPTLQAIEAGKTIALANKETLVAAGHLVMDAAKRRGVNILPVDSEHSAIFQCLQGETTRSVRNITLTASGGAFRDRTRDELADVTVEQALLHPNWSMGAKLTVDSATMANKGLEVIEAHWLFGIDYDQINVVIHPESIVHSYVEFIDRSVIAQLGCPDMRVPIQYALSYPERIDSFSEALDLTKHGTLHFKPMDYDRFRCLRMAFECGRAGGTAPAVFNAANEVAVARFLRGEIAFLHIETILEKVLERHAVEHHPDLDAILAADAWARAEARSI